MAARKRHLAVAAAVAALTQAAPVGLTGSAWGTEPPATGGSPLPVSVPSAPVSAPETPVSAPSTPASVPTTQPPPSASRIRRAATTVRLSNERTQTTWSHPVEVVPIRARPSSKGRVIAQTHLETEDGYPEVYLLLERTTVRGRAWVRLRIPGRPNGRTGWVPRGALEAFHVTRWMIEINVSSLRLKAYYRGKLRFTAPVGVGKASTPTPTGNFWIRERMRVSNRGNIYWPYALGTSDYSTLSEWPGGGVVGIHGDLGAPQLIPGTPSHGCVRMHNADIAWLAPRVQLGTPVHIVR